MGLDYKREIWNRDTLAGAKASRQGQMTKLSSLYGYANGAGWTNGAAHSNRCLQYL